MPEDFDQSDNLSDLGIPEGQYTSQLSPMLNPRVSKKADRLSVNDNRSDVELDDENAILEVPDASVPCSRWLSLAVIFLI